MKSKADADDEIMVTVNNKVEEWKVLLYDKDQEMMDLQGEVMRLREQLIAANMDSEKASVTALTKVWACLVFPCNTRAGHNRSANINIHTLCESVPDVFQSLPKKQKNIKNLQIIPNVAEVAIWTFHSVKAQSANTHTCVPSLFIIGKTFLRCSDNVLCSVYIKCKSTSVLMYTNTACLYYLQMALVTSILRTRNSELRTQTFTYLTLITSI